VDGPIHWTHGFYGTVQENEVVLRLFDWFLWSGVVLFIGTWNRQCREKSEPWKKKQF
jgi:hypothetical protein